MGDPFAFRAEGSYFLVGTTSEHEGFQIYRSGDLAHWQRVGWALRKTPGFWVKDLFWAPEVRAYRGRYYMVYSGLLTGEKEAKLRLGLAVSDRPEGPYANLYTPWFDAGYGAIDGDIFIDVNGKPYLFFSRNGSEKGYAYGKIYGVALAADLSKPLGAPKLLLQASQPWELVHAKVNRCNEGPTVFQHNGLYYMTYSANDTSTPAYGIGYATAKSPLGPWKKAASNPLLKTMPGTGISGPGHNSIVASPDGKELWIVYHTHADPAHPSQDRVVNADRIAFTSNGGMHVVPTRTPQLLPSGAQ
jgi:beta-xylosidase